MHPQHTSILPNGAPRDLAAEIWRHYVVQPGMVRTEALLRMADRTERFLGGLNGQAATTTSRLSFMRPPADADYGGGAAPYWPGAIVVTAEQRPATSPPALRPNMDRSAHRAAANGTAEQATIQTPRATPAGVVQRVPAHSPSERGTTWPQATSATGLKMPVVRASRARGDAMKMPVVRASPARGDSLSIPQAEPAPATFPRAIAPQVSPMPSRAPETRISSAAMATKPRSMQELLHPGAVATSAAFAPSPDASPRSGPADAVPTPPHVQEKLRAGPAPRALRLIAGRPVVQRLPERSVATAHATAAPYVDAEVSSAQPLRGLPSPETADVPQETVVVGAETGDLDAGPDLVFTAPSPAQVKHTTTRTTLQRAADEPDVRSNVAPAPALVEAPRRPPPAATIVQRQAAGAPASPASEKPGANDINLDGLAEKVWVRLVRRLSVESERRGFKRWH
jgi:hypothetical protein